MLPMYFITETCYSDGKIKWNGIVHHFYIKFINLFGLTDRWQDFLCPFGKKEPDVRKSNDRKIKRFEFTLVDHIHR